VRGVQAGDLADERTGPEETPGTRIRAMMSYMDIDLGSAEVKQRANRLMRDAGRRHLTPIGVQQVSRSARVWTADRGSWLINVEFQPSAHLVGSYLNVGLQHLWIPKDYRVFEYGKPPADRRVRAAR
jgi:hypothetical protein